MSIINFDTVGDHVIQYYINEGWEIVANAPNPDPHPNDACSIVFVIKKTFDKKLNREEKRQILDEAWSYCSE
jgi:hypothetical protein